MSILLKVCKFSRKVVVRRVSARF